MHGQTASTMSGLSDPVDLHSLIVNPLRAQNSITTSQAAIALLLAANSQGNSPMGVPAAPAYNPPAMLADTSPVAPPYLQAAILAHSLSSAGCNPALHLEEAILAQQAMAGMHNRMLPNGMHASQLNSHDVTLLSADFERWLCSTGGLHQLSVSPPYATDTALNAHNLHMVDSQPNACVGLDPGFGPQRQHSMRDIRYTRHNPY